MEPDVANELAQRASGPVSLRLLLQPTLAILFAIRDGVNDAKSGAEPYIFAILFRKDQRRDRIASAWASAGTVVIMAILLDCLYQYLTPGPVRILEAIAIAVILCAIPYTLVRGPVSRIYRRIGKAPPQDGSTPPEA